MPLRRFLRVIASVCLAMIAFRCNSEAKADTYQPYLVDTSAGTSSTLGITATGTDLLSFNQSAYSALVFTPASGATFYMTAPILNLDNGAPCTIADVSAFTSVSDGVCNNGREAFVASTYYIRQGIFIGSDPLTDLLYSGQSGNIALNSSGDIAFDAYRIADFLDGNYLLIDTTTRTSVTPEPSSFFLLGSGLVSAVCLARRRFQRYSIQ